MLVRDNVHVHGTRDSKVGDSSTSFAALLGMEKRTNVIAEVLGGSLATSPMRTHLLSVDLEASVMALVAP